MSKTNKHVVGNYFVFPLTHTRDNPAYFVEGSMKTRRRSLLNKQLVFQKLLIPVMGRTDLLRKYTFIYLEKFGLYYCT